MTFYDSSLLIDYLGGDEAAIRYVKDHVDERSVASPLVLFEVYQGEVFGRSPTDFDAVARALDWLDAVLTVDGNVARSAAELQDRMAQRGSPMAPRDAFIAGTALHENEPLATCDTDFDSAALREDLTVDVVSPDRK